MVNCDHYTAYPNAIVSFFLPYAGGQTVGTIEDFHCYLLPCRTGLARKKLRVGLALFSIEAISVTNSTQHPYWAFLYNDLFMQTEPNKMRARLEMLELALAERFQELKASTLFSPGSVPSGFTCGLDRPAATGAFHW